MSRILSAVRMGKFLHFALSLLVAAGASAANAVDEEKPNGRVCLSIFEPGPPEKEEVFQVSVPAGAGKIVRAYIDASEKCTVLVAAITKDGKLANGWRPQLSEVPGEFEEILLPKTPVKWDWTAASAPFDFYVLFLAPGTKEIDEAKKLVDAMQNPKWDDRVLGLQTGKLKELIGRLAADKSNANQGPLSDPEIGGVFRGAAFPLRQIAPAAHFAPDRPRAVIPFGEATGKERHLAAWPCL